MNQEQAEANWTWDPKRGCVPPREWFPRRPRLTKHNIRAQQELARPRTLTHTSAKATCPRKKSGYDVWRETTGPTTITHTAEAAHIENVNCLWCRRDYFAKEAK